MFRKSAMRLCLILICVAVVRGDDHHSIETTSGIVEGVRLTSHLGKSVDAYLGIPYATPPVGDLRFRPPLFVDYSNDTIEAKQKGNICPQLSNETVGNVSEDCLNLNVWVPNEAKGAAVLVFIHGSEMFPYATGSGNEDIYDGTEMAAENNIIVVTLNYRLNVFGFLFMEQDVMDAPGNMGLMDQALALIWIKDNILAFGGDPGRVTIFGEGSGGISVALHLLADSVKHLYQQAIVLNGAPLTFNIARSKAVTKEIVIQAACSSASEDSAKMLACLREKSIEELTNAAVRVYEKSSMFPFPTEDGDLLIPEHPKVLDYAKNVKVVVSTFENRGMIYNAEIIGQKAEESFTVDQSYMQKWIEKTHHNKHDFVAENIKYHYTDWKHPQCSESIRKNLIDLSSDFFVECPANKLADQLTLSGNDVWRSQVAFHSSKSSWPEWAGFKGKEALTFFFGHALPQNGYSEEDHQHDEAMMKSVGNFVKNGNPNPNVDQDFWPKYNLRHEPYWHAGNTSTIRHHLRVDHCAYWNEAFLKVDMAADFLIKQQCH